MPSMDASMSKTVGELDPEMAELIKSERERQVSGIELIASENFTSKAVMEVLGSVLTNKYSEGQPGARYYGGNEFIDKVENLCKKRALDAYGLKEDEWGVNVQPYSGSPANFAVYTGLLTPHDRVMGLDLPSGGHLTHGFYTATGKRISATSIYFESLPYKVHPDTGLIDFDALMEQAKLFRPKMLLCGASAYARVMDWAKFRAVADEVGAILLADMAHISGLVATGVHPSPFPYCDVVTTTTHKSLRGPRAGMIFYNLKQEKFPDIKERIDMAVFPALQGGPHNHQIGALAVQLKEVQTPEFKVYCQNVVDNCKTLAESMTGKFGYKLVTGGTDNHLILWDVSPQGVNGRKVEMICDMCHITLNKNCVPGDKSALNPSGVRIGTCAMTTRGCGKEDMESIAGFLDRAVKIAVAQQEIKGKKIKDFEMDLDSREDIIALKKEVNEWSSKFDFPV